MRPLILIYFSIGIVYGNPEFNHPTPTPSATPAILSNLPTPTPSIAPSLLIENVPHSGQFGIPPVVRIQDKPQRLILNQPQFGLPFGDLGYNFAPPVFNFAEQGFNFGQPRFNFVQPGLNFGQQGFNFAQPGFNFPQTGFNFPQSGLNFDEQFLNIGGPQFSFDTGSSIGLNTAQFSAAPVKPAPTVQPSITPTRPTPVISSKPAQLNISPGQVNVSPIRLKEPPIKSTSPSKIEYLAEEKNVGSGGTIVHKHIYFHVAPPEPEIERPPKVIIPPPRKQLRIIFIKAPAPPKPIIAVPPSDERTIIYVLARKPDAQPEIKFETTTPALPPKPEVYFIRYDAKKQSAADVDTSTESNEKAHEGQSAVTQNPTFNIDTRLNEDATDVNEGLEAVTLNLNEASLTGGSALSQAVTGIPDDNSVLVSTTPASSYGPTHHRG